MSRKNCNTFSNLLNYDDIKDSPLIVDGFYFTIHLDSKKRTLFFHDHLGNLSVDFCLSFMRKLSIYDSGLFSKVEIFL